jgi:hypothetical protein
MWRPAHGATTKPGPSRPASGYGRALGRPGPCDDGPLEVPGRRGLLDPATFVVLFEVAELMERDVEVGEPVTP